MKFLLLCVPLAEAALGMIADDRAGFIDFDALPKEGVRCALLSGARR